LYSVGNFTEGEGDSVWDVQDHSFNDVYISNTLVGKYQPLNGAAVTGIQSLLDDRQKHSMRDWLVGLIEGDIDASIPVIAELSADGFITTTLRWEQYPDMDLHTEEPNGDIVYYGDRIGTYGVLDKDNTDGLGPEHYTSELTCSEAANKTWKFGIHQVAVQRSRICQ